MLVTLRTNFAPKKSAPFSSSSLKASSVREFSKYGVEPPKKLKRPNIAKLLEQDESLTPGLPLAQQSHRVMASVVFQRPPYVVPIPSALETEIDIFYQESQKQLAELQEKQDDIE
jgi:hypothetical protein